MIKEGMTFFTRLCRSLFVLVFLVSVTACSAKRTSVTQFPPESSSEELSQPKENVFEEKIFFSEITILIETKPDDACKEGLFGRSPSSAAGFSVSIADDQHVKSLRPIQRSALNVTVEMMGLDKKRIERSLIDHGSLKEGELSLLFRRRPGLGLEVRYLNESLVLRGDASPVYSFSASEDRSGCRVVHNINIFQDRTGLFDR